MRNPPSLDLRKPKRLHPEDDLQKSCVRWFAYQHPLLLLSHTPNGGKRNAREAARFKALGVKPGIADLILWVQKGGYGALCIELKAGKGTQSEHQQAFERYCRMHSYCYRIVRSLDEFIGTVTDYLAGYLKVGDELF